MSQLSMKGSLNMFSSVVLLETLEKEPFNLISVYVDKHTKGLVRYPLSLKGFIDTIEKSLIAIDRLCRRHCLLITARS